MILPVDTRARFGAEGADRELEADVMRFVAILALCLVAISTLVDELPPAPPPAAAATPQPDPGRPSESPLNEGGPSISAARTVRTMVPASPASPPASASARVGDAVPITPSERAANLLSESLILAPRESLAVESPAVESPAVESPAVESPAVESPAVESPAVESPAVESGIPDAPRIPPTSSPASPRAPSAANMTDSSPTTVATKAESRRGFTLRFATDAALLRLVARGAAEVYVFDGGETFRLTLADAGPSFSPAPGPSQFHAIAGATVPAVLQRALAARGPVSAEAIWGVTLPAETRRTLARLIRSHDGGELVIDARGRVRLEADDA